MGLFGGSCFSLAIFVCVVSSNFTFDLAGVVGRVRIVSWFLFFGRAR